MVVSGGPVVVEGAVVDTTRQAAVPSTHVPPKATEAVRETIDAVQSLRGLRMGHTAGGCLRTGEGGSGGGDGGKGARGELAVGYGTSLQIWVIRNHGNLCHRGNLWGWGVWSVYLLTPLLHSLKIGTYSS